MVKGIYRHQMLLLSISNKSDAVLSHSDNARTKNNSVPGEAANLMRKSNHTPSLNIKKVYLQIYVSERLKGLQAVKYKN